MPPFRPDLDGAGTVRWPVADGTAVIATLSPDPDETRTAAPSRVLARLSARHTALGASGIRKKDHIVDPRTGEPVRGRLASWAAVPRPQPTHGTPAGEGPRLAPTAIADALTTAFMLLDIDEIATLCDSSSGLEAWILPDGGGSGREPDLMYFGRQ